MVCRLTILAVFCVAASAQHKPAPPSQPPKTEATELPPEIRSIADTLSGTWSITWSRVEDETRETVIGYGHETWKFAPGGVPFIEENRSVANGKPAEDYAAIWWDAKARIIRGIWCDAQVNDEGCSGFTVTLEGNDIVMSGEWEMHGKRFTWRELFSVSRETGLTQRLQTAEVGKALRLVEIIRGTKQ